MRLLAILTFFCLSASLSAAAIVARRPVPVLHSIFDTWTQAEQPAPFNFYRPFGAPPAPKATRHPGRGAVTAGACLLVISLIAFVAMQVGDDGRSAYAQRNDTTTMLGRLSTVTFIAGIVVFVSGVAVSMAHRKPPATKK